jgi:hypothetical protein
MKGLKLYEKAGAQAPVFYNANSSLLTLKTKRNESKRINECG